MLCTCIHMACRHRRLLLTAAVCALAVTAVSQMLASYSTDGTLPCLHVIPAYHGQAVHAKLMTLHRLSEWRLLQVREV